jgi:hypothetical protein
MAKSDDMEELDMLIDRAVDTFFVEVSEGDEQDLQYDGSGAEQTPVSPKASPQSHVKQGAMDGSGTDSLTFESFYEDEVSGSPRKVTSGDIETDRAIDLAVDTLFVEEPDVPTPETAEVEVAEAESEGVVSAVLSEDITVEEIQDKLATQHDISFQAAHRKQEPAVAPKQPIVASQQALPLKKLQEAILTLEWEISPRSVAVLSKELARLRARFQDNVTVDFAALAMGLVLNYVTKRMSRSHPESIRFLLVVTGFLHRNAGSDEMDALAAFHQILTRYEAFKTLVRKAEGLPERRPVSQYDLAIDDPETFSKVVEAQALNLLKAGQSLAKKLDGAKDSRDLIRSFRFLVTRSVNRIFESTRKKKSGAAVRRRSGGSA